MFCHKLRVGATQAVPREILTSDWGWWWRETGCMRHEKMVASRGGAVPRAARAPLQAPLGQPLLSLDFQFLV